MSRYRWAPYVPVAERKERARKKMQQLRKKGKDVQPVEVSGLKIAKTFWGKAWCDHIESFSDYSNRLPRGRTYVRNGSVVHLEILKGEVQAMVAGTSLYTVKITIKTLSPEKWKVVKNHCSGQIGSLLELLQGKLSKNVMAVVTDRQNGLFPLHKEIKLDCSCPDWAVMCKHVAAVLYGVGARLDENPELLFLLRGVDHEELIDTQADLVTQTSTRTSGRKRISEDALTDVFGIEVSEGIQPAAPRQKSPQQQSSHSAQKSNGSSSKDTRYSAGRQEKASGKKKAVQSQRTRSNQEQELREAFERVMARGKSRIPHEDVESANDETLQNPTGKMVREFRKNMGMTQAQLACLFGVNPATIGNWERKSRIPALQSRNLKLWKIISNLKKKEAWDSLEED